MFEIKNLFVNIGPKKIIDDLSLKINDGEVHAIMGPNGAGKSSLANALMGYPKLEVSGQIILDSDDISSLKVNERAQKGLFLGFQNPQEIDGVNVYNLLRKAKFGEQIKDKKINMEEMLKLQKSVEEITSRLGMGKEFIKRDLNVGFSGGEKKRNEMIQMISLDPKVVILDEIDSGLDIDALRHVANAINQMRSVDKKKCFLLITHYDRILEHLKPDFVHVMVAGKIVRSGDYTLAKEIEEKGYKEF
ncbi:MAG: Fe-S cluster assembly ATPase SufC [Candidatus Micrarchaeota archaeon]